MQTFKKLNLKGVLIRMNVAAFAIGALIFVNVGFKFSKSFCFGLIRKIRPVVQLWSD